MTPQGYLDKASRALASAKLLLADGDVEGSCNRAYYAMFDAAHAALAAVGAHVNPAQTKTHSGLIGAFGLYIVKTGRMSAEFGRALNEVERMRRLADYTGDDISPERAAWAVEQAQAFLLAVQTEFMSACPNAGH
jgi:uncharacterized protein (UPF0332 family)